MDSITITCILGIILITATSFFPSNKKLREKYLKGSYEETLKIDKKILRNRERLILATFLAPVPLCFLLGQLRGSPLLDVLLVMWIMLQFCLFSIWGVFARVTRIIKLEKKKC